MKKNNNDTPYTPIGAIGEFGLLRKLTSHIQTRQGSTIYGIGDDAAVLGPSDNHQKMVVSTDLLIEGVHFDMHYYPLKQLGYKAVMVNLSDIYAMNATPSQITVSMGISSKFSVEAIDEIYQGIRAACQDHEVDIIGGDTTANPQGLVLSITAMGWAAQSDIVFRSGAQDGDFICVSGDLGAAYMGLMLLEREKQVFLADPNAAPQFEGRHYLVQRQLQPQARRQLILDMQRLQIKPNAMIDVSDGIASDIMHIAHSSGMGAKIVEKWIPIHQDTKLQALDFQIDPTVAALNGGEDYELLFTIAAEHEDKLHLLEDVTVIGRIVPKDEGIYLLTDQGQKHQIEAQGWQHFEQS